MPDIPADCLVDLKTENNELSAWWLDDQQTNRERILAALAGNRDNPANVDYMTFDFGLPNRLHIALRNTRGETADSHANRSWHYDLIDLSARQLVELAVEVHSAGKRARLSHKAVQGLIRGGVEKKELNGAKINPKLGEKLFGQGSLPVWKRVWRSLRMK